MTRARFAELPPEVRHEISAMSHFIRQCKTCADKEGLAHWRARQEGYLQGLVDAGKLPQAEMDFIIKEDRP